MGICRSIRKEIDSTMVSFPLVGAWLTPWIYAFPYMGYHAHFLYVKLTGDGKFTSDDIFKCNWLAKTPLNNTAKGVELLFNCLQHFPT